MAGKTQDDQYSLLKSPSRLTGPSAVEKLLAGVAARYIDDILSLQARVKPFVPSRFPLAATIERFDKLIAAGSPVGSVTVADRRALTISTWPRCSWADLHTRRASIGAYTCRWRQDGTQ
jgi:hypothetical protein